MVSTTMSASAFSMLFFPAMPNSFARKRAMVIDWQSFLSPYSKMGSVPRGVSENIYVFFISYSVFRIYLLQFHYNCSKILLIDDLLGFNSGHCSKLILSSSHGCPPYAKISRLNSPLPLPSKYVSLIFVMIIISIWGNCLNHTIFLKYNIEMFTKYN